MNNNYKDNITNKMYLLEITHYSHGIHLRTQQFQNDGQNM